MENILLIFASNLALFWVAITIILAVIEIFTQGLTTIWFCGGAFAACVLAILGVAVPVQVAVFIVISVLLLYFTRPLALKKLNREVILTNAEAMIGKIGIVTEQITQFKAGQVKVDGLFWSAVSEDGTVIENNTEVSVLKIEGVKLIVKKAYD